MGPLAIYLAVIAILLLLSIAVRIWKHAPTRVCPLCDAEVEIGRSRCQVCGYQFSARARPGASAKYKRKGE